MELFRISQFAKMIGITPYMLRKYEESGVLKPHYRDEKNGYRYYSDEQYREFISNQNVKK